ncbi:MAG: hypothetical protein SA339_00610 [Methanomassiliicoccus sp.]|nr:hypothetical protein [Methanomassiliicoccus sp.]
MAVPVRSRALNRSSRAALIRKDRQGVASTIGTIMALLVFLAFMALIVNSYVPAWMLDNERSHMNVSVDQFGELKGKVDSMVSQQLVTGDSSINMYAPMTMGASGVPVFASPTAGLLTYNPQGSSSGINVQFNYSASGTGSTFTVPVVVDGGGKVELYAPNRYYVQQWLAYENGAIILKQQDGQSIRAYPNLDITKSNNTLNIAFTQIDLIGNSQSLTGSDTVGFSINLVYIDSEKYSIGTGAKTFSLRFNTTYGDAWYAYFDQLCKTKGLTNNTDYVLTKPVAVSGSTNGLTTFTFTLKNCNELYYNRAYVSMTMLTS